MSLITLMLNVFKIKKLSIGAYLINTFLLIAFYWLLLDSKEIFYPATVSLFIFIIYFSMEVIKYRSFTVKLLEGKKSPNYKADTLDLGEQLIFETVEELHNKYITKVYNLKSLQKNRDSLFSQWIHNLKTSITIIDLACEKGLLDPSLNVSLQDIKEENHKLKINLEQCLNVLRLDDFSRDYIPTKVPLVTMINEVINSKKREFIYKGVYPKVYIDSTINVYTDKKWCSYMVDQILSNAIKYSLPQENKNIYIEGRQVEDGIVLAIRDEAIGIDKEDLPRIFEPFFTGNNGRRDKAATGIGLYMVKIIGEKLGHKVWAESVKGEGSTFNIKYTKDQVSDMKFQGTDLW